MSVEQAATWAAALGAVAYGTGDFVGGFASRRLTTFSVVAIAQAVAVAFLLQGAVLDRAPFSLGTQNWICVLAGLAYAAGVISIYEGLAHGRVAIVSSICGLLTIVIPLAGDVVLGRNLAPGEGVGIAFCAAAAILIVGASKAGGGRESTAWSVRAGVTSGIAFGAADLCLGTIPPQLATDALLATRCVAAAVALALALIFAGRLSLRPAASGLPAFTSGVLSAPDTAIPATPMTAPSSASSGLVMSVGLAVAAGLLDTLGHYGYVHAATRGSMGVAAALVAIFPGVTVLLAAILLRERITRGQIVGLACGASGIMFIIG